MCVRVRENRWKHCIEEKEYNASHIFLHAFAFYYILRELIFAFLFVCFVSINLMGENKNVFFRCCHSPWAFIRLRYFGTVNQWHGTEFRCSGYCTSIVSSSIDEGTMVPSYAYVAVTDTRKPIECQVLIDWLVFTFRLRIVCHRIIFLLIVFLRPKIS